MMTHGNDFLPGASAADYDGIAVAADGNSWMNRLELSKRTLSWRWW